LDSAIAVLALFASASALLAEFRYLLRDPIFDGFRVIVRVETSNHLRVKLTHP